MGVYIPNISKQRRCEDCFFYLIDGAYTEDNEWVDYEVCEVTEKKLIDQGDDCPLIDIVQCKDCKYWHNHEWSSTCDKHIGNGFPSDYFCADGKRRSE